MQRDCGLAKIDTSPTEGNGLNTRWELPVTTFS